MVNLTWTAADMDRAFFSARTQIEVLTRPNERAAGTPTGDEMRLKWCTGAGQGIFDSMRSWRAELTKLALFNIWRDLLLLKYGSGGALLGVNVKPYDYSVP